MHKKLSSFGAMLALVAGSLGNSGTAHATCKFGPVSAWTHDNTTIVSSSVSVFGPAFQLLGQNYGTWSNGGFVASLAQRYDSSPVTTGVMGAAYTIQLKSDGTSSTFTDPYTNLQNSPIHGIFTRNGYTRIAQMQVQVWFCQ